ncbi:MAG TPA: LPXTG cell wall anchor domain-containing protein [Candidatus Saccharimonas sp.]|nr:LPXTG cell wall anchor domain-containing protein [Candidatus Saccharimonas sp.]
MTSDVVKTIAGLAVIALIVVATFLYGNAQREAQQKRDAETKQAAVSPTVSVSPRATVTPTATIKPTTTPTPKVTATPKVSAAATTAVAGATATPLPQTGSEGSVVIGLGAMVLGVAVWQRSRRVAVVRADRSRS